MGAVDRPEERRSIFPIFPLVGDVLAGSLVESQSALGDVLTAVDGCCANSLVLEKLLSK